MNLSDIFCLPLPSDSCIIFLPRLIERALNRDLPARMEDLEKKKKEPHIPWFSGSISLYVALLAVKFNAPSTWFTGLVTLVFGVNQSEVLREHLDQNVRHVSPIRCTGDLATVLFPPPFEIQMTCAFTWQRPILIKNSRHAQPCIKIEGVAIEMHKEQKEYRRIPKEQMRQRQIIPV